MSKSIFVTVIFLLLGVVSFAQETMKTEEVCYNPNAKGDTTKRSIKSAAVGKIGTANFTINYHSPGVRGRTIWGGLVPYNDVWVTGAHYATNMVIDKDIIIAGTPVPKGKYAFFTIPGKDEWTLIVNKNWDQHLTDDYLQKEDVLRVKVKPQQLEKNVERLQYYINDNGSNAGTIAFEWEKVKFELPVAIAKGR